VRLRENPYDRYQTSLLCSFKRLFDGLRSTDFHHVVDALSICEPKDSISPVWSVTVVDEVRCAKLFGNYEYFIGGGGCNDSST
jgi:hypothetical protein